MRINISKNFKQSVKTFFGRGLIIQVSFGIMALFVFVAIFGPLLSPYSPYEQDLTNILSSPTLSHLFGTDDLGRDVATRILYGARISFLTSMLSSIWAAIIGITLGLIAGYFKGPVSQLIMRVIDAQMSIPPLILTMFMAMIMGKSILGISLVIGIGTVPLYTRMLQGMVLSIKNNDYITASKIIGQKESVIMFRHILPNCFAPLIVTFTMNIGIAIMIESGLAYLGIGITPPTPAWGVMVSEGYKYLTMSPIMALVPGFCIMLVVIASNIVGDGIRDALDPKLRGKL